MIISIKPKLIELSFLDSMIVDDFAIEELFNVQ